MIGATNSKRRTEASNTPKVMSSGCGFRRLNGTLMPPKRSNVQMETDDKAGIFGGVLCPALDLPPRPSMATTCSASPH